MTSTSLICNYFAGGWNVATYDNAVIEFDTETESFAEVGRLHHSRGGAGTYGLSVVKIGDLQDYVFGCITTTGNTRITSLGPAHLNSFPMF